MPICDGIRSLLGAYIDGECTVEEAKIIETHLCACEACRVELDRMKEIDAWIKFSAEEVPGGLHKRIMSRVYENSRKPRNAVLLRRISAVVAACAAVALLTGVCWRWIVPLLPLPATETEQIANAMQMNAQTDTNDALTYRLLPQADGVWLCAHEPQVPADALLVINGDEATLTQYGTAQTGRVEYDGDRPVRLIFSNDRYCLEYGEDGSLTVRREE